ncbi:hypothetical protein K501DRAFT_288716 [Backusella circina FSU 941]|nr:hypothetical protein K501DRAFT_288716 [Backusella circina FSU 941]
MAYSRVPPLSSTSHEEWDLRNKGMKTQSGGGFSVSSNSSRQTNAAAQEALAKVYFIELEKYLTLLLSQEAAEGVPQQRVAARQKLSKLNNLQFHELATDVYDELMRRNIDERKSFLPVREDFHPRRNQARQKLATLPNARFKDLASDVYHEIRRRYPFVVEDDLPPPLPKSVHGASPQPSQSTNIIPVKGMISVESIDYSDDDDDNDHSPPPPLSMSNHHENAQSIDSLMADLGNMVKTPRPDNNNSMNNTGSNGSNMDSLRFEYERQISTMAKRIQQLEISLEDSGRGNPNMSRTSIDKERQMRLQQVQEDYRILDDKYTKLSKEHNEQQLAVKEVKDEIKQLIEELKNLSTKNEELRTKKDTLDSTITTLTEELKSWKTKYESAHFELRSFKAKSVQYEPPLHDTTNELFLKPTPTGVIGQNYIIDYQTAIDDLMKTSRSSKPSEVLFSMKVIVMACKAITSQVEEHEVNVGLPANMQADLYAIKARFSTVLTNLLSASKNYANGMGISPVSLVDAAAGNLTITVVDLVKLLGMHPMDEFIDNNKSQSLPVMANPTPLTPSQLSEFLKTETDHIIASVQSLLGALRSNDGNLFNVITSIVDIIANIIATSKRTFSFGNGIEYAKEGGVILGDLGKCNEKIVQIRDLIRKSPGNIDAMDKRKLAQESYEIAKFTKELINMLDM